MKPTLLTMEAFGPYGDTEVVDFRKLGATTLFLVAGETGAGKTAILDAMCFALFGEASGRERQGHSMRSGHADGSKLTRVTLEFEIKGIRYKAERTPKQERPKQRGEGTTTANATAEFHQWTGDHWEHLKTGTTPVGKAIVERIGFGAEQFRQVIVLPQGEFRKLLTAKSSEREQIFAHLFETARYQQLQDALKRQEAALKTALKEADAVRNALLTNVGAENLDALKTDLAECRKALGEIEAQGKALQAAAQQTRDALERGRQVTRNLKEAEESATALTNLAAKKSSVDADRVTSTAAEHAATLEGTERALTERERDRKDSLEALEGARAHLAAAQDQIGPAKASLEKEQARKPEREKALLQQKETASLSEAAEAWDQVVAREVQAKAEVDRLDSQLAQTEAEVPLAEAAHDARKSDTLQTRLLAGSVADIQGLIARLKAAQVNIATLVDALVDGEPCRVCGSTDHPSPAAPPKAEDDGDIAGVEDKLRHAEAAAAQLPTKEAALADAHGTLDATRKKLETTQTLLGQAKETLHSARTERSHLEEKVPQALREPGAIQQAIAAATKRVQVLDQAFDQAQRNLNDAQSKLDSATTRVRERTDAHERARVRHDDQGKELDKSIAEAGFETRAAYQLAKRSGPERQELRERVQRWDQEMKAATDRNTRAMEAAKDLVLPDMPALEAAHAAAMETNTAHVDLTLNTRGRVQRLQDALEQIERNDSKQAEQIAAHTVMGRLSEVANGKRGKRVTFERFVQAEILEQVLVSANRRLHTMSNGRYQLARATESEDHRKLTGLDLNVLDANTGIPRPAHTLSGGEGFEASLALALGLADTVQERSGGIHLDSIFVDEGFGSLGGQDLDAVMQALQDLQHGGRLVGVISHVGEIKERIQARLEVHKTQTGSHTRFVVP